MRDHPSSRWIVWVKSSKQTSPLKELNQLVESVQNEYIKYLQTEFIKYGGKDKHFARSQMYGLACSIPNPL